MPQRTGRPEQGNGGCRNSVPIVATFTSNVTSVANEFGANEGVKIKVLLASSAR